MSTYKRLCLLLCSLFMFCVGFLSVSSRAYAYTAEDGFYPISVKNATIKFQGEGNVTLYEETLETDQFGVYVLSNPQLDNLDGIIWNDSATNMQFVFPYNPDVFDYYILGSVVAKCTDVSLSTFKPGSFAVGFKNVVSSSTGYYNISDMNIYNVDTNYSLGYGFSGKLDFESAGNTGIYNIIMYNDKDGNGSKPPSLRMQFGIMAIPKSTSESEINQRILNKLSEMQESITDSIGSAADQVMDAIEDQYGITPGESFGVQDLTSQVEEKLGVLSFGADTLNNFLGLFQASNAESTVLTFPGFTIDVQGESYQVWNDIQFDLAFLEENFGFLIDTVRTVTVLCVWLAVLGYLVKAYEHLVNNKG